MLLQQDVPVMLYLYILSGLLAPFNMDASVSSCGNSLHSELLADRCCDCGLLIDIVGKKNKLMVIVGEMGVLGYGSRRAL